MAELKSAPPPLPGPWSNPMADLVADPPGPRKHSDAVVSGAPVWLSAIYSLCAFAGGVLVGLAVAAATRPATPVDSQQVDRGQWAVGSKIAEPEAPASTPQSPTTWEPFAEVPQLIGPGSWFQGFAARMGEAWPEDYGQRFGDDDTPGRRLWAILDGGSGSPTGHLDLTVLGEGKLPMEVVVFIAPSRGVSRKDVPSATLIFRLDWVDFGCDPEVMRGHLLRAVEGIGRGLELRTEEAARLWSFAARVPITSGLEQRAVALVELVGTMPPGVVQQFARLCRRLDKRTTPLPDPPLYPFPAVGAALSDRYVVDLAVVPFETMAFGGPGYDVYDIGPWWSLSVHGPRSGPTAVVDEDSWPQLTVAELDAWGQP